MTALPDILATLLPGEAPWPSGTIVADTVVVTPEDLAALLAALPAGFKTGDEAALKQIEQAQPALFDRVVNAAYLAYYANPEVRAVLEQVSGYEARPPQPLGYDLPPFDDSLLARQRRTAPFWRDPDAVP